MIIKEIIIPDKNIFNLLTVAFKFPEEFAGRNIASENWNYRDLQVSRRIILDILVDNKEIPI